MFSPTIRKRPKLFAGIALMSCMVFTVMVFFYKDNYFIDPKKWAGLSDLISGSRFQKVLLPTGFQFPENEVRAHLKGTSGENWEILQLEDSNAMETPPLEPGKFKTTESSLFGFSKSKSCNIKQNVIIGTDESQKLSLNLAKFFEIFREEAETYGDTYNQHILPIFEKYMDDDKLGLHWFRFSGSSVWLKDFNVHFVVSRLTFSQTPAENNPRVSLLLAQIFDERWEEIEDVRLVFPTNKLKDSPSFQINGQDFMLKRFPCVLLAPFYVNEEDLFWGTEDPRMILVRNTNGHEEPIVVFNACHGEEEKDEEGVVVELTRSMFITYPFQRQRGKRILALGDEFTSNDLFLRTNHLVSEEGLYNSVEKNWTPFLSSVDDYDQNIFFASLLEPLMIMKCELWADDKRCSIQEADDDDGKVGALRGGTPLYSLKRIELEDKEFFFGLARAHLVNCGCGKDFYRPNLVVISRKGSKWRVSHVSSSIDLGMNILPWKQETNLCTGVNAMIPNGIESIDHERDLLSVYVSVSDMTVERVTVHGVLQALENAKYWEDGPKKHKGRPVKCAVSASVEFCKIYGEKHQKERWFRRGFEIFSVG